MSPLCVVPVSNYPVRGTLRARLRRAAAIAAVGLGGFSLVAAQTQPVNPDAKTIADFNTRIKAYLELHNKFESTLPKLPPDATPQQMDRHQRLFGPLVQTARAGAKRGDLFNQEMEAYVRRVTRQAFSGKDGKQMV